MASKDQQYWEERAVRDFAAVINQTEDMINGQLTELYQTAEKEIQAEIDGFYQKFADQEKITLAEAKQLIRAGDFKAVDFDALTQTAIDTGDDALNRQLSALSKKGQINRLELLQLQINGILARLYDKEQENVYEHLVGTYSDSYYRTKFNMDTFAGIHVDFAALSEAVIMKAVSQPWHKGNFSDTIWGHRKALSDDLKQTITNGLIQGKSVDKMTRDIEKRCGVAKSNAKRLVRTETNFVHNQATKDSYDDAGIEKYQFLATLDFKTSDICQRLDRKVFPLKDARAGENYPPAHPNCRSTVIPYTKGAGVGTRTARDANGKNYEVPDSWNYEKWFNSLSKNQQAEMQLEQKKARNHLADKKQYKKYREILGKETLPTLADFKDIKYTDINKWSAIKKDYAAKNKLTVTKAERYALNKYISPESYILNEKLRNGTALSADDKTLIGDLDAALRKMPKHKGMAVRSVSLRGNDLDEFLQMHQPGDSVEYKAYTSFAKTGTHDEFANIQLYVESKKARDISKYNPDEAEVIYLRNSPFKVIQKEEHNGKYYIMLEEDSDAKRKGR